MFLREHLQYTSAQEILIEIVVSNWKKTRSRPHLHKSRRDALVGAHFGRREAFVCFCKYFSGVLDVEGLLLKRPRVPFTSGHGEEIAAIDVDRCGDLIERISHGVDYRFTERNGLFEAERLYTVGTRPSSLL